MIIFDGISTAAKKEATIAQDVARLAVAGKKIAIGAIVFSQDSGSQLYTRLKSEAASRVGIQYLPYQFSITDAPELVIGRIAALNEDPKITGIIIQKPTKKIWQAAQQQVDAAGFVHWWTALTSAIEPSKDVDGLHPSTLTAIEQGIWRKQGRVLPATCQAVLEILESVPQPLSAQGDTISVEATSTTKDKVLIVGKSDLLGIPLYGVLKAQGRAVELLTRKDLEARKESGQLLQDGRVVVSATGFPGLITGEMVQDGVVLIDVGEPRPDVAVASIERKAAFLTPVPGGVGPMTVVCLLENAVKLVSYR